MSCGAFNLKTTILTQVNTATFKWERGLGNNFAIIAASVHVGFLFKKAKVPTLPKILLIRSDLCGKL